MIRAQGYFSLLSAYGVLCLLAPGSVLSVASLGSVLSVASVASTASVLSIGSINSYLSIASRNCNGRNLNLFADCTSPAVENYEATVSVLFAADEFEKMATCTLYEKTMYDARGEMPPYCDYVSAQCIYTPGGSSEPTYNATCEVKRKGHSSWRSAEPWERPSLKIKFDDKVDFKPGWKSKKLTLNNMVSGQGDLRGGVDGKSAYQVFTDMGYPYSPNTMPVRLNVYKGGLEVAIELYAAVETISDKYYMKKHFSDDYILFEYEGSSAGKTEFKRGGGKFDDDAGDCDGGQDCTIALPLLKKALGPPTSDDMEIDALVSYAAGERTTMHYEGSCFSPLYQLNNAYLAYNGQTEKFSFIPHGVDQTFRGCASLALFAKDPICPQMAMCMDNATCRGEYEQKVAKLSLASKCASEVAGLLLPNMLLAGLVVACVLWLFARAVPVCSERFEVAIE